MLLCARVPPAAACLALGPLQHARNNARMACPALSTTLQPPGRAFLVAAVVSLLCERMHMQAWCRACWLQSMVSFATAQGSKPSVLDLASAQQDIDLLPTGQRQYYTNQG